MQPVAMRWQNCLSTNLTIPHLRKKSTVPHRHTKKTRAKGDAGFTATLPVSV